MAKRVQVTETELKAEASKVNRILKNEKKVKIFIPTDPMMPGSLTYYGFINGVPFSYPRNEIVEVPESVAMLIENNAKARRIAKAQEAEYQTGAGKLIGPDPRGEALANARAILGAVNADGALDTGETEE